MNETPTSTHNNHFRKVKSSMKCHQPGHPVAVIFLINRTYFTSDILVSQGFRFISMPLLSTQFINFRFCDEKYSPKVVTVNRTLNVRELFWSCVCERKSQCLSQNHKNLFNPEEKTLQSCGTAIKVLTRFERKIIYVAWPVL